MRTKKAGSASLREVRKPVGKPRMLLRIGVICLCLMAVTAALYAPVRHHGFIDLDDDEYVTQNPPVRSGLTWDNIGWAFTHAHSGNWHPLTWISHMTDCQLWGPNPAGHHLTSVGFHTVNAVLLFLVLQGMTGALWRSALVAALFAWHPLHVESVAWVAERKDVLSTFFWFLTMAAYGWYARKPKWERYLAVMVGLALGLMAKPMLVTLPFVLLLLDYWPLGRLKTTEAVGGRAWCGTLWRLTLEKLPLFALAAASSVVTVWAQRKAGAVASISSVPLPARLANSVTGYACYLKKMVWPNDLSVYYPQLASLPAWQVAGSLAILAAITGLVIIAWRRSPYLAVGWAWYLGTLVPVIGLVQVGNQAMADRYTYIPLVGVFIMIAWGVAQLLSSWPHGRVVAACAGVTALIACLGSTAKQIPYWRDSVTLFERSLAVAPGAAALHHNLANVLLGQGQLRDAEAHCREALRLTPNFPEAHNNLARALNAQGKFSEGIPHLEEAIRLQPDARPQLVNLALIRAAHPDPSLRDGPKAVLLASHAAELTAGRDPAVLDVLGMALAEADRFGDATKAAQAAHDLAVSTFNEPLARAIGFRLELYRQGRPYRVPFGR